MKKLFYFIIIVLIVGMWLGINIAKNQPFFSNPFADEEVAEKAKEKGKEIKQKAEDTVERMLDNKLDK